jgi:hypothetical protein
MYAAAITFLKTTTHCETIILHSNNIAVTNRHYCFTYTPRRGMYATTMTTITIHTSQVSNLNRLIFKNLIMKKTILISILLLLFSISFTTYGEGQDNATTGTFTTINATGESVTINYSVAPAYPDNLAIQLRPSSTFMLKAHIVNHDGTEVLKIKQESVTGRYANSIDISTLPHGSYYFEVLPETEGQQPHRIAFAK